MTKGSFRGFPPRPEVTPLPNIFFSELLPQIQNIVEAKVIMQIFFLLSRRKGYPRFVSFSELKNDMIILKGLHSLPGDTGNILKQALDSLSSQGIIVQVPVDIDGYSDDAYFINNQIEKETIARILDGTLKIPRVAVRKVEKPVDELPSDIYSLYEQNIGILTPIIADELQDAEHRFPADWVQEAFKEAVKANVRNWKYIFGILKRWEREGKKDGKYIGDSRKERDPDKYHRGKYGHLVQR